MQSSPPSENETVRGFLSHGYAPSSVRFDEMLAGPDTVREHWRTFVRSLDELGPEEWNQRWTEARHLIRENGVTYNVYGDPQGLERPWQLDPIPLIVDAGEADALDAGLVQRGRLLEAILDDLYGPQSLVKSGLVPPELLYANPYFLRPCLGIHPVGGRRIHLLGIDLGRGPDGNIRVLGDRSQAPSGAGYSLENRIVLSRMVPEVFRDCNVQRLALFFRNLRDSLRNLAPQNLDNPRIVLLTPGPYNETYFEHAYLARYLGFTLVEGGDLTVRDNRVYLKLLDGLQPVDVVFRRLDDDFCDPLELRGDSFLGVPGLVQAIRAGNVAVANSLGSGLVETPALLPYLPVLCRRLLGEELRLPSVETYWCGDPKGLDHVLANLSNLVLKRTLGPPRGEPIFGAELSASSREDLAARIRREPMHWVGQEFLDLSTAPVLTEQGIQPRPIVVRTYLGMAEDGWALMPGGLTRFSGSVGSTIVSIQRGGGSKDTWVLTTGPVSTFSMLRPSVQPVELSRGGSDLPSRAADNLFWLGRYVERAEGMVRLLRGIVVRLTEKSGLADAPELPVLLHALTHLTQSFPGFVADGDQGVALPEGELFALVFDRERPGSLARTLASLYRVAATVRDRISLDMWRVLRGLDLDDPSWQAYSGDGMYDPDFNLSDLLDLLDQSVLTLAAFGGLALESMTRGHGWRFLDMGRRGERCQNLIGLLRTTLVNEHPSEGPLLEALLEIADSSMTYRRRYLGSLQTGPVLDLLLADETNPRSLVYQLQHLQREVDQLPSGDMRTGRCPAHRLALSLLSRLQLAEIDHLALPDASGNRRVLEELLTRLEADLPLLTDAITQRFLSHLQTSRHLGGWSH